MAGSNTPVKDTVTVDRDALSERLATLVADELAPHSFKTGSKGFFAQGKLGHGGERFQATVNVTLVGSKEDAKAEVTAGLGDVAQRVAALVRDEASAKTFASGKRGVYAQGKVTVDGQRFQVSAQAVHVVAAATPAAK